jgi:hypothetical protein
VGYPAAAAPTGQRRFPVNAVVLSSLMTGPARGTQP